MLRISQTESVAHCCRPSKPIEEEEEVEGEEVEAEEAEFSSNGALAMEKPLWA